MIRITTSPVSQIGVYQVNRGLTGNTGNQGSIGLDGIGLTGNTGSGISGITLQNRKILTTFSDGTTAISAREIYGKTGGFVYSVDFLNNTTIGSVTLAYEANTGTTPSYLSLRPIKVFAGSNFRTTITGTPSDITVNVVPRSIMGFTTGVLPGAGDSVNNYLVRLKNNKYRRLPIKPNEYTSDGVVLPMSNMFEIVRGLGQRGAVQQTTGLPPNVSSIWTQDPAILVSDGFYNFGHTLAANCVEKTVTSGGALAPGIYTECTLNPNAREYDHYMHGSRSRIFVARFSGNERVTFFIPDAPTGITTSSFEVYIYGAKNYLYTDGAGALRKKHFFSNSTINWPYSKEPCFGISAADPSGYNLAGFCDLRVTFFGIAGQWYATPGLIGNTCSGRLALPERSINLILKDNCTVDSPYQSLTDNTYRNIEEENLNIFFIPNYQEVSSNLQGITGACCTSDGTCTETTAFLCGSGYFHGYGTTCGNTYDSICNKVGACCIDSGYAQNQYTCSELKCSECIGISFAYYGGNYSKCSDINCSLLKTKTGACCDGLGSCKETTLSECLKSEGFYQGDGSDCSSIFVCSTGTGPCCINGNCNLDSAENCFKNNGYFLGRGRYCGEFTCPQEVSCLGYVNGIPLMAGQHYGGGIVVGKFIPGTSEILGARKLFDPDKLDLSGLTYNSEIYTSIIDHTAYGITKNACNLLPSDAYIIIVYPEDLTYTDVDGVIKNTFAWGGTGSSWGPLLDSGYNYNDLYIRKGQETTDTYLYSHLMYNEGFWAIGNTAISAGITSASFPLCTSSNLYGLGGVEKLYTKSPYNLHGLWHRSWGLYNTIRAINAHNTYNRQYSVSPGFAWSDFTTTTEKNAFDAVRLISDDLASSTQGITGNVGVLSGWYLPSHDELAFIAARTTDTFGFNINQSLMLSDTSEPMNGTYWSSTGTFNYFKNEGVYYSGSKPSPGSVAISMNIDVNGRDYKVFKSNRENKLKVRPIRMIRCDAQVPSNKYLWFIPSVVSDISKQINQRNIDIINITII